MNRLPAVKAQNIVIQKTDDDVLLYDTQTHQAYALNEAAALVYYACSEGLTMRELKDHTNLTDEAIYLSLSQMSDAGLLSEKMDLKDKCPPTTRREIIKLTALTSAVALPLISHFLVSGKRHPASSSFSGLRRRFFATKLS